MPHFSIEFANHPYGVDFEPCYSLDVWLPDPGDAAVTVRSYVSETYRRSVVSEELARRLNLRLEQEEAIGEVILQTDFEIGSTGPVIHRSAPCLIRFKIASRSRDKAYIHFCLDDLEPYLGATRYDPQQPDGKPFMVLRPADASMFCSEIPMERPLA